MIHVRVLETNLCKMSTCTYVPSEHMTLKQRQKLVWNNVTTLFKINFDVVPTLCTRWVGCQSFS